MKILVCLGNEWVNLNHEQILKFKKFESEFKKANL